MEFVERDGVLCATDALQDMQQAGLIHFNDFMDFPGGARIVHKRGRSVYRFESGGRAFFLKRNYQHPAEVWKAVSRMHLPKLGARTEWENIQSLQSAGIPTVKPIAFGERRCCGIETTSFTVTEELYDAEPLDVVWRRDYALPRSREQIRKKNELLKSMAALAQKFHAEGMNHQDFYLNHFFLGSDDTLFLIDLQRVQRRPRSPRRYIVKDLAQLNYSTRVYGGFSNADRLRFFIEYSGCRRLNEKAKRLVHDIHAKTERIARHDVKLAARRRLRGELPPA